MELDIHSHQVPGDVKRLIQQRYFDNSPIVLEEQTSGQEVRDGIVVIGARAGPEVCWTNLIHEMAHLVEIDLKRITQWGWGLRYGKYWECFGKSGYEPQTDQSVRREERVWAFQLNFLESFGISISEIKMVSSATWLPAFCYVKPARSTVDYRDRDRARLEVIADRVARNREIFTTEMFDYEWRRRMEYLRDPSSGGV